MPGQFIDYYLPFIEQGKPLTAQEQATQILTKATKCIESGCTGVAITYSANYDQSIRINETYQNGQWQTHTNGANQAQVIFQMEELQENQFRNLQSKMRIAPITTLTYSTFGGKSHKQVVNDDLENIKRLLDHNWTVLGWINQISAPDYAVGGGIVQLPAELSSMIQKTLKEFSQRYGIR